MSSYHILFISSWYPNRNNPGHGIFNRAFAEAAALRCKVSVIHVSADEKLKKGFETETTTEGKLFTVHVYYPGSPKKRSLFNKLIQHRRRLAACRKAYEIIRENRGAPDLIQLNVVLPAGPGALMLGKKFNLPLVVNEGWTGYDPLDGRYKGSAAKHLTRKVIAAASAILPVSDHLRQLMEIQGLSGKYRVVPNVVDTILFSPIAQRPKNKVRFIHVSALDDAQKNVSGILESFMLAKKEAPDIELVIAGDGPDAPMLKSKAARLFAHGSIRFLGRLGAEQLVAELNAADALVMFSNYETFCVAVPEALACGKPVITSDAGGIMSYMTSDLGIIVPRRDTVALKTAMVDFARKKYTFQPAKLRGFVTEHFSPEVVSKLLLDVYSAVMRKE